MTKRNFEERKSVIRGQIIDAVEFKFDTFEIETEYTRSETKAANLAMDALGLDPKRYMIRVTEIVNEAVKPVVYDAQSLIDFAVAVYDYEIDAEPTETQVVIPFTVHCYSAQVWAVSGEDYTTEYHEYETTVKLGKVDARAAVKMNYEHENKSWFVIGIHNDTRQEFKRYALIERDELKNVKTK